VLAGVDASFLLVVLVLLHAVVKGTSRNNVQPRQNPSQLQGCSFSRIIQQETTKPKKKLRPVQKRIDELKGGSRSESLEISSTGVTAVALAKKEGGTTLGMCLFGFSCFQIFNGDFDLYGAVITQPCWHSLHDLRADVTFDYNQAPIPSEHHAKYGRKLGRSQPDREHRPLVYR